VERRKATKGFGGRPSFASFLAAAASAGGGYKGQPAAAALPINDGASGRRQEGKKYQSVRGTVCDCAPLPRALVLRRASRARIEMLPRRGPRDNALLFGPQTGQRKSRAAFSHQRLLVPAQMEAIVRPQVHQLIWDGHPPPGSSSRTVHQWWSGLKGKGGLRPGQHGDRNCCAAKHGGAHGRRNVGWRR
jgi:hypothetical protein